MNNSTSGCLSNGLAQGIAATLASTQNGGLQNGHAVTVNGHGGSVQSHSAVGNGLKEFLLEQQHLVSYISDHSRLSICVFSSTKYILLQGRPWQKYKNSFDFGGKRVGSYSQIFLCIVQNCSNFEKLNHFVYHTLQCMKFDVV